MSMYLTENLPRVLVPKYYKSVDNLIEDAFKALLNLKPGLKVEMAIELYLREEVSLSRAAEMAGMDIESFKEILKMRGLKVSTYIGSKEDIERGSRLIWLLILDTDIASAFAKAGHFDVLIKLFGKVGITPMVYEELQTPLKHGHVYPEEIFKKAELVTVLEEEQREYLRLKGEYPKIGKGEVESLVVCRRRGNMFSSFDKIAISVARELGVNVITAGAIFKGLMIKGIAAKEEVFKIVQDIETSDNRLLQIEL